MNDPSSEVDQCMHAEKGIQRLDSMGWPHLECLVASVCKALQGPMIDDLAGHAAHELFHGLDRVIL